MKYFATTTCRPIHRGNPHGRSRPVAPCPTNPRFSICSPSSSGSTCLDLAVPRSPAYRCISFLLRQPQSRFRKRPTKTSPIPTPTPTTTPTVETAACHGEEKGRTKLMHFWRWARIEAGAWEVFLAACLGSALDLDHFLAAGSVRISRATALPGRPWGHSVAAFVLAVRTPCRVCLTVEYILRHSTACFTISELVRARSYHNRRLTFLPPASM